MDIRIFTTGGTIDKIYFDELSEFQVGAPQIGEVLQTARVAFRYSIQPLMRKDSLEITEEDRQRIREAIQKDPAERILITHGTDTMTETALGLRGIPDKTIVITGSLAPARFRESDAIFNIGYAVAAVQTLPEGVYLCMNGRVYAPDSVRKNRQTNRFEKINFPS
jgi:L-asparaginase